MAVREKKFIPNHIYFITFTICKWQKVFSSPRYFDLVYKWFDHQKKHYNNKIHGYVIMPNHFHGLIHVSVTSPPLSKLIQNGKRFLAYEIVKYLQAERNDRTLAIFHKYARREKNAKHKVFEERYDSKLMDERDLFLQKLEYIHNNPCQEHWQLVHAPEEYEHSSAGNYILGRGRYDVDIVHEF